MYATGSTDGSATSTLRDMDPSHSQSMMAGNFFLPNGRFEMNNWIRHNGQPDLLTGVSAPNAFHDAGHLLDVPRCHPETRVAAQHQIMNWIHRKDNVDAFIMWLYAAAGIGKSAIARNIAERCHARNILLSSFFFLRTDHTRNHIKSFVATIAYGITQSIPETRSFIERAIEMDHHIFARNLDTQFMKLIQGPYLQVARTRSRSLPHVIVIDGVDECLDRREQQAFLGWLASISQELPWKILVTSRREQAISLMFDGEPLLSKSVRLALSDEYWEEDIRQFIADKFADIKQKHPKKLLIPDNWPDPRDIEELVRMSSGRFIFASNVIKYLQSYQHFPPERLGLILNNIGSASDDLLVAEPGDLNLNRATPDPSSPNVIIFGQTGSGKSSLINMLASKLVADISSDATEGSPWSQSYKISAPSANPSRPQASYTFWDTAGLNQGDLGTVNAHRALEGLLDLVTGTGINLVIYCVRGSRLPDIVQVNYDLFWGIMCWRQVPIVLVVTGLEGEGVMDSWWHRNERTIRKMGLHFNGHVCITTTMGRGGIYRKLYRQSADKVWELVQSHCTTEAWRITPEQSSKVPAIMEEYMEGYNSRSKGFFEKFFDKLFKSKPSK